jgi:hypothetical protein
MTEKASSPAGPDLAQAIPLAEIAEGLHDITGHKAETTQWLRSSSSAIT